MSIAGWRICKPFRKLLYKLVPGMKKLLLDRNLVPAAVCPSKVEPSALSGGRVRALRRGEIKKLVGQFIDGAVRCKKAGVDGVELHASHGYLIQQFLSPHTNRRTDEYGGSLDNRMRFLLEILAGIKRECGEDYPVIVRLTADECYDRIGDAKGYGLKDGTEIAKRLEEAGADAIDVSAAAYDTMNYWLEPVTFDPGCRTEMIRAIKQAVKIPVIAVNLIRSGELAEELLESGVQDFVALGRPHIADAHWADKVREGRENEIKRCICCLYCIETMFKNAFHGTSAQCAVNPALCASLLQPNNNRTSSISRLPSPIIIGAGVAGMTAAEQLAKKGYKVTVFEKSNKSGGQINLASKPPKKDKTAWCVEDLYNSCVREGVEFRFGVEYGKNHTSPLSPLPSHIIIATGGEPIRPKSIEGADLPNVYTYKEILEGSVILKDKKIAVIGSGMTGLETAHYLAEVNNVTVIEMADTPAPGIWFQHPDDILPKLKEAGAEIRTDEKLVMITPSSIMLDNVKTKKSSVLAVDNVVLAMGTRSVNNLAEELKKVCDKVYVIGDASKVGRIGDATAGAYRLVREKF
jgi:2,4-dienoyl-CoA reductase-like NADH-dependent reductase (Old Yellow Enzyme family)/thioredoxin reductase